MKSLKRKAVGLTKSFDSEVCAFGKAALDLWRTLRDAVREARNEPESPCLIPLFDERLRIFQAQCQAAKASPPDKTRTLAQEFLRD